MDIEKRPTKKEVMGNRIEIKMQFRLDSGSGVRRVDQRFQCAHQLSRVQVDTVDMLKEDQMKRE